MGDVDTLLALMGGDEPPPAAAAGAAGAQRASQRRTGRSGPPGRQELDTLAIKELWNPSVRWNPLDDAAAVEPLRLPSARVELARQTAVRSLQARFKAQCIALNTGWSEPEVNKHFECWMLDASIRRPADSPGSADPLLPPPKMAGDDPGLRKALFASARLQRKAVSRFMSDMQKAVTKAHRTVAQLSSAGGSQKRSVQVSPATVPAPESQPGQRAHEQRQQPMLGWDGKAMLQVRYGSTSVLINQCHWDKLAAMLRLEIGEAAAEEPAERDVFKERVFCLLVRYNSLQGGGVHGGGFQAAIPDHVFDTLLRHFDVCFECFASPLNSRYPHFCSAFPDTDAPFGSVGSFFNFKPRAGSFEANPPFVPNLILKMAEHMHQLLVRADSDHTHAEASGENEGDEVGTGGSPLCFVVIIPSWDTTMGWRALNESPFLAHHLRLAQREHGYTEGAQHCRRSRYRISVGDTSVFFLQSRAAQQKWPVTPEALEDIRAAFTSKHNTDTKGGTAAGAQHYQAGADIAAVADTDGSSTAGAAEAAHKQVVNGTRTKLHVHQAAQEEEAQKVEAMGIQRVVHEAVPGPQRDGGARFTDANTGAKKRKHAKGETGARRKAKKRKRAGIQVVTQG